MDQDQSELRPAIAKWRSLFPVGSAAQKAVEQFGKDFEEVNLPVALHCDVRGLNSMLQINKGVIILHNDKFLGGKNVHELPLVYKIEVAEKLPEIELLIERAIYEFIDSFKKG